MNMSLTLAQESSEAAKTGNHHEPLIIHTTLQRRIVNALRRDRTTIGAAILEEGGNCAI